MPEKQKNWIYYRCQKNSCDFKTIREDVIIVALENFFTKYKISKKEIEKISSEIENSLEGFFEESKKKTEFFQKEILSIEKEEKELFQMRIRKLIDDDEFIKEKSVLKTNKNKMQDGFQNDEISEKLQIILNCLELLESGFITWDSLNEKNLVWLIDFIVSNFSITSKNTLNIGVYEFLNFKKTMNLKNGRGYRTRTCGLTLPKRTL